MSSESSKATRTTLLKRGLFLIGAAVGLQGCPSWSTGIRRAYVGASGPRSVSTLGRSV